MDHLQLYALRDLIAISEKGGEKFVKGLETTLARYDKHITQECLVRTRRRQDPPLVIDSTQPLLRTRQHRALNPQSACVWPVGAALPGSRSYVRILQQQRDPLPIPSRDDSAVLSLPELLPLRVLPKDAVLEANLP